MRGNDLWPQALRHPEALAKDPILKAVVFYNCCGNASLINEAFRTGSLPSVRIDRISLKHIS